MTERPYDFEYTGTVVRWVDGDTVILDAAQSHDFGFGNIVTQNHRGGRYRLTICNTPERGKAGYQEAKDFVNALLPPGSQCRVRTYEDADNWGRYLADIQVPNMGSTSISSLLLQHDLAVLYKRT